MRDTLSYKTVIGGQEVTITRHPPSDGRGLTERLDEAGNPKRKKVAKKPVDDQLHALEMLLESAYEHEDEVTAAEAKKSIAKRINSLTGQ